MTVIVTLLLFTFNLDPKTGRMVRAEEADEDIRRDLILYHEHEGRHDGKNSCDDCKKEKIKKQQKPFYKVKLDEDNVDSFNNNDLIKPARYADFDSDYNKNVSMPHIRDQRLAQYV